jgi:hypothetical protein
VHYSTSPLFQAEKIKAMPAIVSRARTPGIILSSKDLILGMMALIRLGYVVAAQIAASIRVLQNLSMSGLRKSDVVGHQTGRQQWISHFNGLDCSHPGRHCSNENGPPAGELAARFVWSKQEGKPGLF